MNARLALILSCGLLLAAPVAGARAEGQSPMYSHGFYSLADLGYGEQVFALQQPVETITLRFNLRDDAAQGPEQWYILRLNFVISFSPDSGEGTALVSAATSGKTCAQIDFTTSRVDGDLVIDWSTLGTIDGFRPHSTSDRTIDATFSNYLRTLGVLPGENTLTFTLEQFGDIKVESLRILDTSGIEYTPLSPPKLELVVEGPEGSVRTGDTFTVGFEVKNSGGQAGREVVVGPVYSTDVFELIGQDSYQAALLQDSLAGSFQFRALGAGDHKLTIDAGSTSGVERPSQRVAVQVVPRSSLPLYMPALAFTPFALAVGYAVARLLGAASSRKK